MNNKLNFPELFINSFNQKCQMPIAHSLFKQTVLNVSARQLQQHTIEKTNNQANWPFSQRLLQNDTIVLSKNT